MGTAAPKTRDRKLVASDAANAAVPGAPSASTASVRPGSKTTVLPPHAPRLRYYPRIYINARVAMTA